ncbi:MAG: glucose-1-phosphate thymidylyltransferase RfbA [Candidatus Kapabacteria bacterium]|nr:glucose-1-phosphate thymidylyltransferase RfbA [Ignavibacteriota bacterium]MCW5884611.1 glucose-1-phosphate thymidylyltransferase RfbA [Candidatus Kapabacteria bacterium]
MQTKGIILAGGKGTRLYPMTHVISKQLQPVYDKPMIYYPLSTLMLGGIKDILIISTPQDTPNYQKLLGEGSAWGINLQYAVQEVPAGLPQAFVLGEEFIAGHQSCLILGDNLFYGKLDFLRNGISQNQGGTVFAYKVENPDAYGVVEFDKNNKVLSIEEKPKLPKSNFAIPGLYIFDSNVSEYSKTLQPSARGEYEITDLQKIYLSQSKLNVQQIGRGVAWLDTGTPEALLDAANFIQAIEKRQGLKIACLEEIALLMNFISINQYENSVNNLPNCDYKNYCLKILREFN